MEATIDVPGLRKRFGGTVALDGMTFSVRPGQVTGFVGPNGAGKSTTMRVILGLDAADEGAALRAGRGDAGRPGIPHAGRAVQRAGPGRHRVDARVPARAGRAGAGGA